MYCLACYFQKESDKTSYFCGALACNFHQWELLRTTNKIAAGKNVSLRFLFSR